MSVHCQAPNSPVARHGGFSLCILCTVDCVDGVNVFQSPLVHSVHSVHSVRSVHYRLRRARHGLQIFRLPLKTELSNGPLGSGFKSFVFLPRICIPPWAGGILGRRPHRSQLCRRACTDLGLAPKCGAQGSYPAVGWRHGRNACALSLHKQIVTKNVVISNWTRWNLLVHFAISACLKHTSEGKQSMNRGTHVQSKFDMKYSRHARAQQNVLLRAAQACATRTMWDCSSCRNRCTCAHDLSPALGWRRACIADSH